MALTAGCGTAASSACPVRPVPYGAASQLRAAGELGGLPAEAELRRYMNDYGAERAALRAACGG